MKRLFLMTSLLAALSVLTSVTAQANVITQAYYTLGENDSGAVAGGAANAVTADSSGNANNLYYSGAGPTYTSSVASSAASATGSTLALDFGSSGRHYVTGSVWTSATDNYGMEGWFKTSDPTKSQALVYNGNMGQLWPTYGFGNGFGLYVTGDTGDGGGGVSGHLMGLLGYVAWLDSGFTIQANQWFYAALVKDNGTVKMYVNKSDPTNFGQRGTVAANNCSVIGSAFGSTGDLLSGAADNVRIFTFNAGQFSASDLLINQTVPEPSMVMLGMTGLIGLAAYAWRKRK